MNEIFGSITGRIYAHCPDDGSLRACVDVMLTNGIPFSAYASQRVLIIELGDDADDTSDSVDLAKVLSIVDVLAQHGSVVTRDVGEGGLREQMAEMRQRRRPPTR